MNPWKIYTAHESILWFQYFLVIKFGNTCIKRTHSGKELFNINLVSKVKDVTSSKRCKKDAHVKDVTSASKKNS